MATLETAAPSTTFTLISPMSTSKRWSLLGRSARTMIGNPPLNPSISQSVSQPTNQLINHATSRANSQSLNFTKLNWTDSTITLLSFEMFTSVIFSVQAINQTFKQLINQLYITSINQAFSIMTASACSMLSCQGLCFYTSITLSPKMSLKLGVNYIWPLTMSHSCSPHCSSLGLNAHSLTLSLSDLFPATKCFLLLGLEPKSHQTSK